MSTTRKKSISRPLEACLYYTANSLARAISERAEQFFTPLGMSPSQAFLLLLLIENGELTVKELSEALHLAHSTVSRHVDFHVQKSYAQKRQEGRTVYVSCTPQGKKLKGKIGAAWKELYHDYNTVLGKAKGEVLTKDTLKAYDKLMDEA